MKDRSVIWSSVKRRLHNTKRGRRMCRRIVNRGGEGGWSKMIARRVVNDRAWTLLERVV